MFAQAGTGRLGIAICGGKGAVFAEVLLLTGKASYQSWKIQWRKITSLLLILDQDLLKSLCCKHLQQRETLFSHSLKSGGG